MISRSVTMLKKHPCNHQNEWLCLVVGLLLLSLCSLPASADLRMTTTRKSLTFSSTPHLQGAETNGSSVFSEMSANGRFVVFDK